MESTILGLMLDSSVLIAAERRGFTATETINGVRSKVGDLPIVVAAVSVAELAHGIYRSKDPETASRRVQFLKELRNIVTVYSITDSTADIIGRIGAQQASVGINLPFADLVIGACAIEAGYAVATANLRDFERIPGLQVVRF